MVLKFENRPPVVLVHGEEQAATGLSKCLQERLGAQVRVARPGEVVSLLGAGDFTVNKGKSDE
ncbi:MAG: hypothetical protein M3H12_14740 [Chromatiales bacterium]|nr:hypothetical protein [Gammaproteobacteria bacterium]